MAAPSPQDEPGHHGAVRRYTSPPPSISVGARPWLATVPPSPARSVHQLQTTLQGRRYCGPRAHYPRGWACFYTSSPPPVPSPLPGRIAAALSLSCPSVADHASGVAPAGHRPPCPFPLGPCGTRAPLSACRLLVVPALRAASARFRPVSPPSLPRHPAPSRTVPPRLPSRSRRASRPYCTCMARTARRSRHATTRRCRAMCLRALCTRHERVGCCRPSPSHFTVAAPPRGPWAGNAG